MAYRRAPGNHDVNRGRQFIKLRLGDNTTILYDRYLVNRTGSANKFYYTAIAEANGKFYAMGAFGRIGSLGDVFNIKGGKSSPMASCSDMGEALRLVQSKENQKMKGKKDKNTGEMSRYSDYDLGAEEWTQEFAKLMGAYPLPPNNQYAVGGFMDEGFEYTVNQAETFNAECEHCEGEMTTNHKQKCVYHKICKMCLKEFGACPICDLKRKMKKLGYLDAEMREITDGMVAVLDDEGTTKGVVELSEEDDDVIMDISDSMMEPITEIVLDAESTTTSFLKIVGATAAVFGIFGLLSRKLEKNADTLIENPNTGNLKPADYEEIVVESTGYYVPIIPVVLDGSFMGSRFHALPTDRFVYDDPNGIGAHIDIAMTRDTNFLPNEQSLVMNTEAPGQSPYNSMTGQENPDFAYRVIHETNPVSLDGSVAKFIPTDLSGYTGQQFIPTSVYEDMLGIGVSGQTPAFRTPKGDGLGGNRFGSRIANPDMLTNIGGPLTDSVNGDYTDGSSTMTLSQWSIENQVQQISDTEAIVVARGSGERKMIRRV